MKIDLSSPDISDAEKNAVIEVLSSNRLSLGPKVDEFERAVAEYVGTRHAIAINSGTSGLHLLIRAIDITNGDEVITTPFSFVASSNCVLYERGRPVFVDIEPDTWNIDPAAMSAAITPRTKALLPVDAFGQVARMDEILALARKHKLRVIEDSCEALGSTYKSRRAGSLADAGVFGFYPNKQITTGEGGMITTNDEQIAARCRSMRNQGRDTMSWLSHDRLGYNYRLPDINCAIGVVQMRRIEEILSRRDRVAGWYRQRLEGESRISMQRVIPECKLSWFVFVVKLADDYTEDQRNSMLQRLRDSGIGCSNYFAPIHLQKFYREELGYRPGQFPVCERVAARTIALPFHGHLTESNVETVCTTFRKLL